MKIAILAPVSLRDFADFFPAETNIPVGLTSSVMTPLIRYFLSQGHDVVVVTVAYGCWPARILKSKHLTIYVGYSNRHYKVRDYTKFSFEIAQMQRFLRSHPCDIYHAHWEYEFALSALGVDSGRTLVTLHDWPYRICELIPGHYNQTRLKIALQVFEHAQYFSCVSDYIAELFQGYYPDKEVSVIGNAIPEVKFCEHEKRKNENPIFISVAAGFSELKNTRTTIKAFAAFHRKHPKSRMQMYGTAHGAGEAAESWAKENGCAEGIEFCGVVSHDKLLQMIEKADVLIHSSREEAFGMTILEAMAKRTPVIAGNASGNVHNILGDGSRGLVCNIESSDAIAQAMEKMTQDTSCWYKYQQEGFVFAKNNYTEAIVGKQYIEYYQRILLQKELIL